MRCLKRRYTAGGYASTKHLHLHGVNPPRAINAFPGSFATPREIALCSLMLAGSTSVWVASRSAPKISKLTCPTAASSEPVFLHFVRSFLGFSAIVAVGEVLFCGDVLVGNQSDFDIAGNSNIGTPLSAPHPPFVPFPSPPRNQLLFHRLRVYLCQRPRPPRLILRAFTTTTSRSAATDERRRPSRWAARPRSRHRLQLRSPAYLHRYGRRSIIS